VRTADIVGYGVNLDIRQDSSGLSDVLCFLVHVYFQSVGSGSSA